jgi:hypothetical protein
MPVIALLIGLAVLVTAYNNTAGALGSALKQDLPGFFPWLMALAAILGLGYLPGMEKVSRYLLVLVAIVLVLTKGSGIISGFQAFMTGGQGSASTGSGSPAPEPTTAYAGGTGTPSQSEIAGSGPTTGQAAVALTLQPQNYGPSSLTPAAASPAATAPAATDPVFAMSAAIDPALAGFTSSLGFGGLA